MGSREHTYTCNRLGAERRGWGCSFILGVVVWSGAAKRPPKRGGGGAVTCRESLNSARAFTMQQRDAYREIATNPVFVEISISSEFGCLK